ncbi:MAG: TetR/AcrR family transcriptional regulator [Lachnotalea sp.]
MNSDKKSSTINLLMSVAKEIIKKEGYEAVTVRRVASMTQYSYPLLYHYFKDLKSFLWLVRIEMIEDMITDLPYIRDNTKNPIEEVKDMFNQYMKYFFKNPTIFKFFYYYPFIKPSEHTDYDELEKKLRGM